MFTASSPVFRLPILPRALACVAAFCGVIANSRGDVSSLTVIGPNSGSAFSNIGGATEKGILPSLARAEVNIVLAPGRGDDLTAHCTARFEMQMGPEGSGQTLVAFPVTGTGGDAVKVSGFEISINGTRVHTVLHGAIRLVPQRSTDELAKQQPTIAQLLKEPWSHVPGFFIADGHLYPAYYWEQVFPPNASTRIEVAYDLTLHPQNLQYQKEWRHGGSLDVVPFDLLNIETSGKAYLFDYVLRSAATWAGPIGHETVTLTASPETNLDLADDRIAIVGRNISRYLDDDDARARIRAGVVPKVRQTRASIVWEINDEIPTEDILIQIPLSTRRK